MANDKNYLLISKGGSISAYDKASIAAVLRAYIDTLDGKPGEDWAGDKFRVSRSLWESFDTAIGPTREIRLFNSLCTDRNFRIAGGFGAHNYAYSDGTIVDTEEDLEGTADGTTEFTNIVIITKNRKLFMYPDKIPVDTSTAAKVTLTEALNKYIEKKLGYGRAFHAVAETWKEITEVKNTDGTLKSADITWLISVFNSLCKAESDEISLVLVNPEYTYNP